MADHGQEYRSAYLGAQIDSAVGAVLERGAEWDGKQDKLTGQPGQVVGFDEAGNPTPQSTDSLKGDKGDKGDPGDAGGGGGLPSGCIVIWSGASTAIPDGWALCDGSNGTPDLRDRFVVGAGSAYAVGATGGEATHTLTTSEMPSHTHVQQATVSPTSTSSTVAAQYRRTSGTASSSSAYTYVSGTQASSSTATKSAVTTQSRGGSVAHNNMPPYYALCYIMKL